MRRLVNIVAAMGFLGGAQGSETPRPVVPRSLEAPAGEEVVLAAHAKGVQIYACQAGAGLKLTWVLKGPDAELGDASGKTIVHHSAGPTWKHVDGSEVTGRVKENAPKPDAIPWLLLTAAGHKGEGLFSRVTSIQRIHTEGGLAPGANACNDAAKGKEVRSAYEADYYFYAPRSRLAAGSAHYSVIKTYTLGGDGGWDYLTYDAGVNRVFISRGTHVMVMDADSGKVVGDIPDTPGVHGIALAPEFGRGFVSSGRANSVTIFDLKDLHKIGEVKTSENPDAIAYDPVSKRVFTFNGRGHDATAIDAASGTVAGSLPLGGKPEFAVSDGKGRIYVNIEDKSELLAINTQTIKEEKRWPIKGCQEPSGLAMDKEHRRLFAGCDNKVMAVINADTGDVVATPPIGAGVDANAFDPGTQLAFSSNGSGTLTVVHEDSPDKYTVVQSLETARGARTMALDSSTHRVFLVTAEFGPPPAATAENPRPRPAMVSGSFKVLVAELAGQ